MTQELFKSAHSALVFAFNFSGQAPPGVLGRLIGGEIGSGKGLVGLDGAGQAGMILSSVRVIGTPPEMRDSDKEGTAYAQGAVYLLAARFAPRSIPCACRAPCCSGARRALAWDEAIGWITEQALGQLSGRMSNQRLRKGIVARYFGAKINMGELAELAHVDKNTVTEHNQLICTWLRKEEARALHAIEGRLKAIGLVQ